MGPFIYLGYAKAIGKVTAAQRKIPAERTARAKGMHFSA
jgi:hypothetical protein